MNSDGFDFTLETLLTDMRKEGTISEDIAYYGAIGFSLDKNMVNFFVQNFNNIFFLRVMIR